MIGFVSKEVRQANKMWAAMSDEAPQISSSAMLSEAEDRMRALDVNELSVLEDNEIIGVITDQDLARVAAAGADPGTTLVKYAMMADMAPAEEIIERTRRTI